MATVAHVDARFTADTSAYVRSVREAQRATETMSRAMPGASNGITRVATAGRNYAKAIPPATQATEQFTAANAAMTGAIGALGVMVLARATAAVKRYANEAVMAAASYEQTVISIEGIFRGTGMSIEQAASKTQSYLAELRDFAARTPFELPQTLDAVKRLLSIGYAADDVKDRLLPAIGDIVSALGQPAASISAVVYAFGQMKSAGRVLSQDLMQIGNALPGFNAKVAIANQLFQGDMNAMTQAMEAGALDADTAITAIIKAMQEFPGAAGAMERQSKTLLGVMSTFSDTVRNAMIDAILPTMPVLSGALENLVGPVQRLAEAFAGALGPNLVMVAEEAQKFAPQLADLTAALINTAANGISNFIKVLGAMAPALTMVSQLLGALSTLVSKIPTPLQAMIGVLLLARFAIKKLGLDFATANAQVKRVMISMRASVVGAMDTIRLSIMTAGVSAKAGQLAFAQFARSTVVAFKAMGTAARGLIASLGPIGIAIAALTIPFEIFMGQAAGSENAIANLRDEIDATTGSLTRMGREWIANELRTNISNEDLAMLAEYGISVEGFLDALESGGPTLDAYMGKVDEMVKGQMGVLESFNGSEASARTIARTFQGMVGDYEDATEASRDLAAAEEDAAGGKRALVSATVAAALAAGEAMGPTKDLASATEEQASAAEAAAAAIDAMRAENERWTAGLSAMSAVDAATQAINNIGTSAEENTNKLVGTSPKIMAFRGDVISAFEAAASKAGELGKTAAEQRQIFTGELVKIVASLRATGVKDSDIETFLGAMGTLPASIDTIMTAAGTAVGEGGKRFKTEVQKSVTQAFKAAAESGAPMSADAMEAMAQSATDAAKAKMGLTLEPELTSIINAASTGLQPVATAAFTPVGSNISGGIAAGITTSSPIVISAVQAVIAAAKIAADEAAKAKSPSRLFMEVGDNLVTGVAAGMKRTTPEAVNASTALIGALHDSGQRAMQAMVSGMESQRNAVRSSITSLSREVQAVTPMVEGGYTMNVRAALPSMPSTGDMQSGGGRGGIHIENLNVTSAPGERAESSIPRQLRRMAWVAGLDG